MNHTSGKLSFLAFLLCLTACTKSVISTNEKEQANLAGKWNLVSDSTFVGVGSSNHSVDYEGEPEDYFSFNTNGYVYVKEDSTMDTLTFRVVSDTSLIISNFGIIINGVPDTSTIATTTASNGLGLLVQIMVIESPLFLTPGGEFWRKVTLSR